jgi:glycosyltransferase involved in cell wall biosynthesis
MHLFLNGMAASAGGGLTYLRNVVPDLANRSGVRVTVALRQDLHHEFEGLPNIVCVTIKSPSGALSRFWREQSNLGRLIKASGAEGLISAGNVALRNSPVPQILLSGNSLYTSKYFYADLRSRGDYRLLLDTLGKGVVAKRSLIWADCTVAPSEAFADELRQWTGIKVRTIYHGFDHDRFFRDRRPLPDEIQRKLDGAGNAIRLLFVSHYNYYRNFETLFRAIPIIQQRLGGREVKLFLTCSLISENNPGAYRANSAAALVRELNISDSVVELGAVPYELLHGLYRSCQIYTTAAYTETFAHPLVEAMASGLPVVASDLDVHREVCRDAACYFNRFSPEGLAAQIVQIAGSQDLSQSLAAKGLMRSQDFSWHRHVDQMLELAGTL